MSANQGGGDVSGEKERMVQDVNTNAVGDTDVSKMMASQDYEPTEEDRAYKGWKHMIPFRPASKNPKSLPVISAGPLNFATCHWATALIYKAYKTDLTEDDLYDTPWRDSAGENAKRFERFWNAELAKHGKKNASVARAIIRMIRTRLIVAVLLTFCFSGFAILGPGLFVRNIVLTIGKEGTEVFKCISILGLLVSVMSRSLLFSAVFVTNASSAKLTETQTVDIPNRDTNS